MHGREGFGAVTAQTAFGATSGNGVAATEARSDHTHGTPTHDNAAHSAINLSALAAPTTDVAWGSHKITGLLDPTLAQDAATKNYVDAARSGLDVKASVRAASTANLAGITYNATGGTFGRGQITTAPNTLDGVTLVAGDRVLVKDQTTGAQNGIYVVTTVGAGATGVWDRATDFDQDAEVTPGAFTFVEEGTANDNTGWVLGTNAPITIGGSSGTALTFVKFSGGTAISAGNGLAQNGSVFSVVGTANRIAVSGAGVDIDAAYVGQTSITTLGTISTGVWSGTAVAVAKGGTGAADAPTARANLGATGKYAATLAALVAGTELTITHNLGSTDVIAHFKTVADGYVVDLNWRTIDANTIGVTADIAYAGNAVRAVVIG